MYVCFTCRLYGYDIFPYGNYRVIIVNMSQLNISQCDENTDYITWMPTDGVCICVYTYLVLVLTMFICKD